MMKQLQTAAVLMTMVWLGSCDETIMGDDDASAPESCILYAAPGAEADAGDGASASAPLTSIDAVVSKASALKSSCGNAAEVQFADGSLSEEQYKIASEALRTTGIRVGRYSRNAGWVEPSGKATADKIASMNQRTALEGLPWSSENTSDIQEMTPRSDQTANYYWITGSSPYLKLDQTSETYIDWVMQNVGGNLYIRRSATPEGANTGDRIAFRSSSTPSSAVDVWGYENNGSNSGNGVLRLYKDTETSTSLVMDNNEIDSYDTAGLHLNNNSDQAVYIAGNTGKSNYVYMVRGSGRVAIGNLSSTQTTHKLTVDGGIKAEELVIDTVGGADFVFEDDYDLMSLDEVAAFVEENNHLPGVAPAEEMQKEGLEMGAFQIKLLQKIEELTLYTIAQEKRIAALEQQLKYPTEK